MSFNRTRRRTFTTLQRARFFEERKGVCYLCNMTIRVGEPWDIEHRVAREILGDGADDDSNLELAHRACHKAKTREDQAAIAKSNRVRAKHLGAHRPKQKFPSRPFGGFKPRVRDINDIEA